MVVPLLTRPGVTTVPIRVVGESAAQVVGMLLQSGPVQAPVPVTQLWAPVPGSAMQAWVLGSGQAVGAPLGQQLIWWPQPSEAKPQVWPSWAQVLGVQVVGGVPHWFGCRAPQKSVPEQLTPPLAELQV